MKPFSYNGEVLGSRHELRPDLRCQLSLLGGGGGGLGLDASATSGVTGPKSGGVTVTNSSSGSLSSTTWLIIAGVALSALLIVGLIFRGK